MARKVKGNTTTVSSKHQITIPVAALRSSGIEPGDVLRVESTGAGQLRLTRIDELIGRYAGSINSGGTLRASVDELRAEWR